MKKKGYWYKKIDGLTYRYSIGSRGEDFVKYNIDVKFNDAFVRSIGAKDIQDFLSHRKCTPFDRVIDIFGFIPKYFPLTINGKQAVIEKDNQYVFIDEFNKENYR
ncbi:MAG: hypothetical protein E6767_03135 [Dysgonomonas sp.]|nr:hypothetical protein [Dysgonomonas sp.]